MGTISDRGGHVSDRREKIHGSNLTEVQLICVSCSERRIVHIAARRCPTKEIYWQCLECQEASSAIWGGPARNLRTPSGRRRGSRG
jgi:hypothetical protein